MAKQPIKQAGVAPVAPVATSASTGGDWGEAARPEQSGDAAAPVKPATTDEVVKAQIESKTEQDVQRQSEIDPVAQVLAEVEEKIAEATDVGLAFELLKEIEGIPASTNIEIKIKKVCVERVKRHCFDIQQGLPLVKMGANELAKEPGLNSASIQDERLELAGRNDPDIKHLLEKIEALKTKKD